MGIRYHNYMILISQLFESKDIQKLIQIVVIGMDAVIALISRDLKRFQNLNT